MKTRADYAIINQNCRKSSLFCIVMIVLVCIADFCFFGIAGAWENHYGKMSSWVNDAIFCIFIGVMVASLVWLFWYDYDNSKKHGFFCPDCGHVFTTSRSYRFMTTGRCPKCSHELFESEKPGLDCHYRTRSEFMCTYNAFSRRLNRFLGFSALVMCILFVAMLKMGEMALQYLHLWEIKNYRFALIMMTSAVTAAYMVSLCFMIVRKQRKAGLACDECKHVWFAQEEMPLVMKSGRCVVCGTIVFVEDPSETNSAEHGPGFFSRDEFLANEKKYQRRTILFLILWLFAIIAWCLVVLIFNLLNRSLLIKSLTLSSGVFIYFGCLYATLWPSKRLLRKFNLLCPQCGKRLVGQKKPSVAITMHCEYCNARIIAPDPPAAPTL